MKQWRNKSYVILWIVFLFSFGSKTVFAEERYLVPVGQAIGVTLNMKGVTVVDTTDVKDYDGKRHTPAKDAGIKPGDVIAQINGSKIQSAKQFEDLINSQGDKPLEIAIERDGKMITCKTEAALSQIDGHYRIGVWVKDAASGVGTITYYDPETKEFGALGHGILDSENKEILEINNGELWEASIVSVRKGSKGQPGELVGVFTEGEGNLGEVTSNTVVGIKGTLQNETSLDCIMQAIPLAKREEAEEGVAQIIANVEEDKLACYEVEIQKINKDAENTKGMIICVTDKTLLDKTGGIVQGMSGSPILQNGKIVGAVTHVFVNDPTRGYGIFIENMLAEAEKVK